MSKNMPNSTDYFTKTAENARLMQQMLKDLKQSVTMNRSEQGDDAKYLTLQAELSNLKQELADTQTELQTLRQNYSKLQSQHAQLKKDSPDELINKLTATHEAELRSLRKSLQEAEGKFKEHQAKCEAEQSKLRKTHEEETKSLMASREILKAQEAELLSQTVLTKADKQQLEVVVLSACMLIDSLKTKWEEYCNDSVVKGKKLQIDPLLNQTCEGVVDHANCILRLKFLSGVTNESVRLSRLVEELQSLRSLIAQ